MIVSFRFVATVPSLYQNRREKKKKFRSLIHFIHTS